MLFLSFVYLMFFCLVLFTYFYFTYLFIWQWYISFITYRHMLYISLKTIILYSLVEMFFLKGLMTFWSLLQASLKHTSLKLSRFRIVHVIRGYAGLKPGPCGGRHREHTYHQGNVYLSLRTTSIGIKRVLDVTHWSTWCLFFYLFFRSLHQPKPSHQRYHQGGRKQFLGLNLRRHSQHCLTSYLFFSMLSKTHLKQVSPFVCVSRIWSPYIGRQPREVVMAFLISVMKP